MPVYGEAVDEEIGYVYQRVVDAIAQQIDSGRLRPGDRLPGEKDLAEEHGVALGTVRRALTELRDRGMVVTLPAKGTYVRRSENRP
jgi:DNA-binding GntR family transcriptional regulator